MSLSKELTLHLQNANELLRPSGSFYRKRTINRDAEDFIVEEAENLSHKESINIVVHLLSPETQMKDNIEPALRRHFCYRKEQSQKKFKRTLQYGWRTLFIALGLLVILFIMVEISIRFWPENKIAMFIRESFIVLGWVALWRPMELLLYDWYPIKRDINLFRRLEQSNVKVIVGQIK